METITFDTIDNKITFTVKSEFVKEVPNYKEVPVKDLIEKHNVFKFFHNPNGPAVIDHKSDNRNYFLDGKLVEGEELEKIKHREQFNGKMDNILNESVG